MRFVVRSNIVLVVFWFNAAAAQEGYLGHDHDKWRRGFYQSSAEAGFCARYAEGRLSTRVS